MKNNLLVKIQIENKKEIEQIIQSFSKKYQLDLSLPISKLISCNQALHSLNQSFALLSNHIDHIVALKPDFFAFEQAFTKLDSMRAPEYSLLAKKDSDLLSSASNSAYALKLFSQFLSQSVSAPSVLPQSSGYLPSGQFSSPLDLIFTNLQRYHNLPDFIDAKLQDKINSLTEIYQDDIENGFLYPCQLPLRKKQLDSDILAAKQDSFLEHINILQQIYDLLKFWLPSYYDAKVQSVTLNADLVHLADPENKQQYLDQNLQLLNNDKSSFDQSAVSSLVVAYQTEMSHLSSLKSMGLISYDEIIEKSWEYFRSLKAIAAADGEVSEAEQELIDIFRQRAQRAQLAKNRDGSDLTQYYNYMKFLDEGYYEWKKARIEEDVRTMDLAEEQKAALVKARLKELRKELEGFEGDKTLFGRILDSIGVPQEEQGKVKRAFQDMANSIAGIFSQMYNNLGLQRDKALTDLEKRAKTERMTEVWLAKEKEKINEEYEKKQRALKRTEQKMQIASATVNTLEGITNALTIKPAWLAPVLAASVGALGFAQVKLIADQKFASGGLFRGKGSTTSDSNIVAVSDHEYIVSADRVKRFGVGFFDALNFGGAEQIRKALNSFRMPALAPVPVPVKTSGYAAGGQVHSSQSKPANIQMNVTLKCDSKELARAVARGNKKIIST